MKKIAKKKMKEIKLRKIDKKDPLENYSGPLPYVAGLDFLKVSLHLDWNSSWFMEHLQEFKEEFQDETLCPNREARERSLRLDGGIKFNMLRKGTQTYPYVLKTGDISLMFSNHQSDAQCPNCRIEIGSMSCWSPGYQKIFMKLVQWIRAFGGSIRTQKISEVHLTADLLGVDFKKTGLHDIRRWIARAQKWNLHGEYRTPNYIALGKGDLMLRVYDKTGELKEKAGDSKDVFFQSLWANHLQSLPPKHVTRIEFQIRRINIKQMGISTVGDLVQKLNSIWDYCTRKWARFCAKVVKEGDREKKNYKGYNHAVLWDTVCDVRFNDAKVYTVKRQKVRHFNVEALKKQMAGCALSICGALGLDPDDKTAHVARSIGMMYEQIEENYEKSPEEYQRKISVAGNNANVSSLLF